MINAIQNSSLNRINIHTAIQIFSENIVNVFLGIYLFQTGVPLWMVFFIWSFFHLSRIPIRPLVLKFCLAKGLKKSLLIGTICYSALFPIMGQVQGIDIWLAIFALAWGIVDPLYWLPYHTSYAMLGDTEHRGKQTGIREALGYIAKMLAPLLGGLLINQLGFLSAFYFSAFCMLLSSLPLLNMREIQLPPEHLMPLHDEKKVSKIGMLLYGGWGFYEKAHQFTWSLVLFFMLENYVSFGGLMSLAILFQVLGSVVVGHAFDNGKSRKIYPFAIIIVSLSVVGYTFFALTVESIIVMDIIFMTGFVMLHPILHSAFYNASKKSHHPLWFQYFSENGWDFGSMGALLLIAGLLYIGADLRMMMLLSFGGLAIIWIFLNKYFSKK